MKVRALLFLLAVAGLASAAPKSETLKTSGWHSKGDAFKTEAALRAVKGVTKASADFGAKTVTVEFDDAQVQRAQLEKAIADAGYATPK